MTTENKTINRRKHRTSEFRDIRLEKKYVGGILFHHDMFRKSLQCFDTHAISSDKIKWILDKAIELYSTEGIILDVDSFEMVLNVKASKKAAYMSVWKSLIRIGKKTNEAAIVAARKKLQKLFQARLMEIGIKDTIDQLTKAKDGQLDFIEEAASHIITTADRLQVHDSPVIITDPLTKYEDFEKFHKKVQKNPSAFLGVPTGIAQLDERMKGLRHSELGLITAGTGVGKSVLLLDMATSAWKSTGDIVYVTIEMPEDQVRQRFYCRISGIDYNYFRNYELTEGHFNKLRKTIKQVRNYPHKFHIIDVPESTTVDVIKAQLETLMSKHDIRAVYVDYLNILQSSNGTVSMEWRDQIEVAIHLKQRLCRYFQLPVWTANQLTGGAHDKDDLHIGDMAFAKNITDHVDVGIYVALSEDFEETNRIKFGFLKTRDFKATPFYVSDNRSKMRFSEIDGDTRVKVTNRGEVQL